MRMFSLLTSKRMQISLRSPTDTEKQTDTDTDTQELLHEKISIYTHAFTRIKIPMPICLHKPSCV